MTTYRIAVLPGDGIGPEVTHEAMRVLQSVGKAAGLGFEFEQALIGGAAIDATGGPLPRATLDLCRKAQAILFGAVGGPKWDTTDPSKPRMSARTPWLFEPRDTSKRRWRCAWFTCASIE